MVMKMIIAIDDTIVENASELTNALLYTKELPDGTKEYVVELPDAVNKRSHLKFFFAALNFVKENNEFCTAALQRYLKCAYGTVANVLDALCSLNVIEKLDAPSTNGGRIYKSLMVGE